MKRIALAIEDTSELEETVASHFGHCAKFLLVDVDENGDVVEERRIANPLQGHGGGACVIPQYIKEYNIDTMLAGGMGARAIGHFNDFGIEVVSGVTGTAKEVLKAYLAGKVAGAKECDEHLRGGHH